jgi:hypothetical protein
MSDKTFPYEATWGGCRVTVLAEHGPVSFVYIHDGDYYALPNTELITPIPTMDTLTTAEARIEVALAVLGRRRISSGDVDEAAAILRGQTGGAPMSETTLSAEVEAAWAKYRALLVAEEESRKRYVTAKAVTDTAWQEWSELDRASRGEASDDTDAY